MTPEETTTDMLGTNIYLTHQLAQLQVRELLADAERQHSANIAYAARARTRRSGIAAARAGLATLLLRAGSWLMPPEALARGQ
jgi:hypothetical protein